LSFFQAKAKNTLQTQKPGIPIQKSKNNQNSHHMEEKPLKQQIEDLLNVKDFDTNAATDIYLKYGQNKAYARHFIRNPMRYERKLRWELSKMIGITLQEFNGSVTKPKETDNKTKGEYPKIITRIKEDLPKLYNNQAQLQKQLTNLGASNDDATKQQAVETGKAIDTLAFRYQQLYDAKEKYFKDGTLPVEDELYPKDEDKGKDKKQEDPFNLSTKKPSDIVKMRGNLVSGITKDENQLKYQANKKLEAENPMPEGEQRTKVETRLAKKKAMLKAIDEYLDKDGDQK
jgi:hypothetical protein